MKILAVLPAENIFIKQSRQYHHEVTMVNCSEKMLSTFHSFKPDVIIIDHQLDAFKNIKEILAEEAFQKVVLIYLTNNKNNADILKALDTGFDDFFIETENEEEIKIFLKNIHHLSDLKKQLYFYLTQDMLTEIGNQAELKNQLLKSVEESDQTHTPFAVLFIDLDNFKMVNENIGHLMGDALLKEIAKRLKSCLRINDYIARLGGDEFVIILKDIENTYDIDTVAQKIIHTMSKPYKIDKIDVMVKLSMGIAFYPDDGVDALSVLQNADIAMYYAKKIGQNNYQFHSPEQQLQYKRKIELENDLSFSLDKNELCLYYQPIYDLKENKIVGMEALLRWHHKKKGILLPDVFIPIAEESGFIFQISEWVLAEICKQASEWELENVKNFKVSFNVSASLLLKKNLTRSILTMIKKSGLPIELFDAEITETVLLSNSSLTEHVIKELKESGLTFSVDDFGTGYSSFTHVKLLPLRAIKIDKSFIKNIANDKKDTIIVETIIELGNRMHIEVVAEGIETEEQLNFLLNKKCKKGQGHLLCPPLDVEKMSILLKNSVLK